MQLPAALRPWSHLLSLFPHDIALTLGTLVHRLHAVVGPLRDDTMAGALDPDGIRGIAARGIYERLLISEWLLADEIPEEFDRRAAAREHLFYDRELEDPSAARESVALFDCGPEQIGAPRIVQLAALILLARRAEAASAQFRWGVLQDAGCRLRDGVNHAEVQNLVHARTSATVTPECIAAWQERSPAGVPSDQWVIGPQAGADTWPGFSFIAIEEALGLERDALLVTVQRKSRRATIEIELPRRNAVRARLLRDPFEQPIRSTVSTSSHAVSFKRQIRFTEDGRRVLGMLLDGNLGAFHVPNAPGTQAGRTRVFHIPGKHRLVAAEYLKKRFVVVTLLEDRIRLLNAPRGVGRGPLGSTADPGRQPVPVNNLGSFPRCVVRSRGRQGRVAIIYFLDGARQLFAADLEEWRIRCIDHGVRDFLLTDDRLIYLRHFDNQPAVLVEVDEHGRSARRATFEFASKQQTEVFFDSRHTWHGQRFGVVAMRGAQSIWYVVGHGTLERIEVPHAHRVRGLVWSSKPRYRGLVVIRPGNRALSLCHARGLAPLVTSSEPIAQVAVDPDSQNIAYVTSTGTLRVYSFHHRKMLLTVEPREER